MSRLSNATALVTGATGLIGSNLVRSLLESDAKVIALGRSKGKLETVFSLERNDENLTLMEGNVGENFPENVTDVDYIFHAASPISGAEIREKPVDTISANLNGTINCLEFLREQGHGRLVIFSSATVYGNFFDKDEVVSEDNTSSADALHTANTPYSESKRMIEVLARSYTKQYGVDTVIVRIGYVYGYIKPYPNTAFYEFLNKASKGQDIVLNNSGMGRRDNIHVSDVVRGVLLVAQEGQSAEAYNVSSNGDRDNYRAIDEIADIIADEANAVRKEIRVSAIVKTFEGRRKPGLKLDNSKLKQLGWSVEVSLKEGIRKTVERFIEDEWNHTCS